MYLLEEFEDEENLLVNDDKEMAEMVQHSLRLEVAHKDSTHRMRAPMYCQCKKCPYKRENELDRGQMPW